MSDTAFFTRPVPHHGGGLPWPSLPTVESPQPQIQSWERLRRKELPGQDAELLDNFRQGDEQAGLDLIRRLHPAVALLARALAPQTIRPDELATTMLVGVLYKLRKPRRFAALEAWAWQTALRLGLRELAGRMDAATKPETQPDPEELDYLRRLAMDECGRDAGSLIARRVISKLIARLPVRQRLVLSLIELEGWSLQQLVEETGWPRWLVRWHLYHAQRGFRRALQDWMRHLAAPA